MFCYIIINCQLNWRAVRPSADFSLGFRTNRYCIVSVNHRLDYIEHYDVLINVICCYAITNSEINYACDNTENGQLSNDASILIFVHGYRIMTCHRLYL